ACCFIMPVIDERTDRIIGFTMLGIEGGEIMSAVQLAMQGGLAASDLRDNIFAHPTLAESLNNLFAQIYSNPI
ncbi:MAG: mercuric reductase, partial [Blastochloris sp.]|nr:mercuric reductase [Blastochloris sp.]